MTDDLLARVRAQLDEDERVARSAGADYPVWDTTSDGNVVQVGTGGSGYLAVGPWEGDLLEVGEHMARHDPDRVRREVDAKRRILDELERIRQIAESRPLDIDIAQALDRVAEALTLPYSERPSRR